MQDSGYGREMRSAGEDLVSVGCHGFPPAVVLDRRLVSDVLYDVEHEQRLLRCIGGQRLSKTGQPGPAKAGPDGTGKSEIRSRFQNRKDGDWRASMFLYPPWSGGKFIVS
jgi:hypothetical protein